MKRNTIKTIVGMALRRKEIILTIAWIFISSIAVAFIIKYNPLNKSSVPLLVIINMVSMLVGFKSLEIIDKEYEEAIKKLHK